MTNSRLSLPGFFLFFGALWLVTACGGQLSDENRKAMAEENRQRKIKRVSEETIISTAMAWGLEIQKDLAQASSLEQEVRVAQMARQRNVEIHRIWPDSEGLEFSEKTRELLDAYRYQAENHQAMTEAVQADGTDYLLVTFPVFEGSIWQGIWLIRIERKEIIRSL
jgi:hypothetical protein